MAHKLNGKTLQADRGFTHNGIQYPRNWLKLSSEAERTALGITWEADPVRADDRYYWDGNINSPKALDDVYHVWTQDEADDNLLPEGKSVGDKKYVQVWDSNTESMVDGTEQLITRGIKYTMKQQVQQTAGSLLAKTDWYVVRNAEKSTAIPADVTTKRDAIRTECNRLETAIDGATTLDALMTVMKSQDWGEE